MFFNSDRRYYFPSFLFFSGHNFKTATLIPTGICFRLQDGEDAGERRAEVHVPHLLPGHHHAARRQVPPPEGTDRDAAVGQGKKNREIYLTTELCQFHKMRSRELRFFFCIFIKLGILNREIIPFSDSFSIPIPDRHIICAPQ